MPYTPQDTIPPEVALQHAGTTIYHLYRNGELEGGRMTYWFTTNPDDLDVVGQFDVRELNAWQKHRLPPHADYPDKARYWEDEAKHILEVIKTAIDSSELHATP